MKLARYHTGRDKFIAFRGAFHGRTLGALSLTGSKVVQRKGFGPLIPGVYHAQYPDTYRRPAGTTPEDHAVACVRFIEDELFRTAGPGRRSRRDRGRAHPGRRRLSRASSRVLRRTGSAGRPSTSILLVFDEVQSGMGRTGKMWAADHFDAVARHSHRRKGIASGLPLSAMIAREEIMDWGRGRARLHFRR